MAAMIVQNDRERSTQVYCKFISPMSIECRNIGSRSDTSSVGMSQYVCSTDNSNIGSAEDERIDRFVTFDCKKGGPTPVLFVILRAHNINLCGRPRPRRAQRSNIGNCSELYHGATPVSLAS